MAGMNVYFFGGGRSSASNLRRLDTRKTILGGKGEALHHMTQTGIPVPPGFTISTRVCQFYLRNEGRLPAELDRQIDSALAHLERETGKRFGDGQNPLLVSVRSGAKVSMPGMMDTILNLGLTDATVQGLAERTGNERFAFDCYRRFIHMFGDVVLGIHKDKFEEILTAKKTEVGAVQDTDLSIEGLKDLVVRYKVLIAEAGKTLPQDAREQLRLAINAVFESWNNQRAIDYRESEEISHDLGTAVNVQAMVFGNTGENSATGVGFTRNPATGQKEEYGEWLPNAQGEDVVAGVRTPRPLSELASFMPKVARQLQEITQLLERHYGDMQDFEFTVQDGKLYLLQTRNGKRTGVAAVKISRDLVAEGIAQRKQILRRFDPQQANAAIVPALAPGETIADSEIFARGLPAGPGAATGTIVFSSANAIALHEQKGNPILVRRETNPNDFKGMKHSKGVATQIGGMTSHAALVARQLGKVTVTGAESMHVNEGKRIVTSSMHSATLREGDPITLVVNPGGEGLVVIGEKQVVTPDSIGTELEEFLAWCKETSRLRVRANADDAEQAERAFAFGAEGIGLCRTEHQFGGDRLPLIQRIILAESETERRRALADILPLQREDFSGLFRAMRGFPVTIRALDPPLHEFLPRRENLMVEIARLEALQSAGQEISATELEQKKTMLAMVEALHELNPMLGHRGCRVGIVYPEILETQARAVAEAAVAVIREGGSLVPEFMIPLVGKAEELRHQREVTERTFKAVMGESGVSFNYLIGTMIEVPRGAVTAHEIAQYADFFSFGTNDLTQFGGALDRDGSYGRFFPAYRQLGIYAHDPFERLDQEGIGELVRLGVERGRKTKPKLKIGICGEHGGDPSSIHFFHKVGLDYVSASPNRVLGAWVAAAQAALNNGTRL